VSAAAAFGRPQILERIEGEKMKLIARTIVAALALTTILAPVAVGQTGPDANDHRRPSVVPASNVAGNSGGRLLGDWFVENLTLSASASPFGGSANICFDIGHRGKVLSPAGGILIPPENRVIEMTCPVEAGRPVVMVMTSADCSSAEPGPFFADTPRTQRTCALRNLSTIPVRSINISVDGSSPVDVHQRRFLEVSPQRSVVFPVDPVFQATPGPATFVAAAWTAEIRGMKRGNHTVVATPIYELEDGPLVLPFIVHFQVVGGRGQGGH